MHNKTKFFLIVGLLVLAAMGMTACQGEPGPEGPVGPQGPIGEAEFVVENITCTECHNDGTTLIGVQKEWAASMHATGRGASYAGGRSGCSSCHGSAGFQAALESEGTPDEGISDPHPVGPDCRACHQVHETYTAADWALSTTDPVALYAFEDVTYDQGKGNLCANCHQPRRTMEVLDDGTVDVNSTHWGPHHGPQSAILLGVGGQLVDGSAGAHYTMVEDGCVTCHLGEAKNHSFAPTAAACVACHGDDFDYEEAQAEVVALGAELKELLIANGLWNEEEDENMTGIFSAEYAGALWNYILIFPEDGSLGVHNMSYVKALLEASIDVLPVPEPVEGEGEGGEAEPAP